MLHVGRDVVLSLLLSAALTLQSMWFIIASLLLFLFYLVPGAGIPPTVLSMLQQLCRLLCCVISRHLRPAVFVVAIWENVLLPQTPTL